MPIAQHPRAEALALTADAPHFNPTLDARELRFAQDYAASHGGLLPQDHFWSNLEARFALDPGRFAHWHPRITGMLERDQSVRIELAMQGLFAQTGHPGTVETSPGTLVPLDTPPGGNSPLAAVPEPGPLSLLGAMVALAYAVRRRGRKANAR